MTVGVYANVTYTFADTERWRETAAIAGKGKTLDSGSENGRHCDSESTERWQ